MTENKFKKNSAVKRISGAKETKEVITDREEERYSERTQILLKKSIKEGIKELAWQNRLSMNGMINKVLAEYIEKNLK